VHPLLLLRAEFVAESAPQGGRGGRRRRPRRHRRGFGRPGSAHQCSARGACVAPARPAGGSRATARLAPIAATSGGPRRNPSPRPTPPRSPRRRRPAGGRPASPHRASRQLGEPAVEVAVAPARGAPERARVRRVGLQRRHELATPVLRLERRGCSHGGQGGGGGGGIASGASKGRPKPARG
jgi:hypothetical protein